MNKETTVPFQVYGQNQKALFTLKIHRGEGMVLLAMNWKNDKEPPNEFVGFAIEYKEPGGKEFYCLHNRISFQGSKGSVPDESLSSKLAPFQKFRWVHFPRNANLKGSFIYRVTPVFMDFNNQLNYGEYQEADIVLNSETYPGLLNVTFTRGFVSSQAFVDTYGYDAVKTLLPSKADEGLDFKPSHPKAKEALAWMGFEAREQILKLLDDAINDESAEVCAVAYDLNLPDIVDRFEQLGKRLKIIIDNSGTHDKATSAESIAAERLIKSAGSKNVLRQHMKQLQHNKTLIIKGEKINVVVCGSTNYSWRAFYVQSNNAMILHGNEAVKLFSEAFNNYWANSPADFCDTNSADWNKVGLPNVNVSATFSPHSSKNKMLGAIAKDLDQNITSNLLFSLAFLYQTEGALKDSIVKAVNNKDLFVYGMSDKDVDGIDVQKPDGNAPVVYPFELLGKDLPFPFKPEPSGGGGVRLHHKFLVIDFDKSEKARVYLGSYNFSDTADTKNGENLLLICDQRIAVSYMIEALHLFDHYHFRINQHEAKKAQKDMCLVRPPKNNAQKPWWYYDYTDKRRIKDRILFSS